MIAGAFLFLLVSLLREAYAIVAVCIRKRNVGMIIGIDGSDYLVGDERIASLREVEAIKREGATVYILRGILNAVVGIAGSKGPEERVHIHIGEVVELRFDLNVRVEGICSSLDVLQLICCKHILAWYWYDGTPSCTLDVADKRRIQ